MSEDAKIALSEKELELVCSTDWILTKHSVIEKVYQLFGSLALSMQGFVEEKILQKTQRKFKLSFMDRCH